MTRVAYHVWAAVAFIIVWLHFDYVRTLTRHADWQIYTVYSLAVAGIAARYLTGIRYGGRRWHRVVFDVLTIVFIALGVNLTGGIYSDLWLVYFIFVIAETLAASARGFLITDAAAVVSYVIATWPREVTQPYVEMLVTRIFFLVLVASIARTIATQERLRQADVSALREALSVSEERRRLARDIHDGIGHGLTRVILGLEVLRRQRAADPELAAGIGQQTDALRGAMQEMRELVTTLRTATAEFDLCAAVRTMAAQLAESGSLEVDLDLPEGLLPLSPHRQYHLTRVIQEALTNCMRHAETHRAEVKLSVVDGVGRARVVASVRDAGIGFDPRSPGAEAGHGLRGMRERLAPYEGRVTVESAPGAGTRVVAEVPADLGPVGREGDG